MGHYNNTSIVLDGLKMAFDEIRIFYKSMVNRYGVS
jgi:hypothetical protein